MRIKLILTLFGLGGDRLAPPFVYFEISLVLSPWFLSLTFKPAVLEKSVLSLRSCLSPWPWPRTLRP